MHGYKNVDFAFGLRTLVLQTG